MIVSLDTLQVRMVMFALSPLCSASVIFGNSILGKAYMSFGFRVKGPAIENTPEFKNAHKAQVVAPANPRGGHAHSSPVSISYEVLCAPQLNEAEWSPLLIAGLLVLQTQEKTPSIAAGLAAFGVRDAGFDPPAHTPCLPNVPAAWSLRLHCTR